MKNRRQLTEPDGVIRLLRYSSDAQHHVGVEAGAQRRSEGRAPRWVIYRSASVTEAVASLQAFPIPVILAESDSPSSNWRELLERIQQLPEPPALILASRLADERLWVEALNLGAYDLLAMPYAQHELIRSVTGAWLHWHSLRDRRKRVVSDRRAVEQWNAAAG